MSAGTARFVVPLYEAFQTLDDLYLAMPFYPGGDLMGLLISRDTLSEAATRFFAAELVLAVGAVHQLGYIHRDLKPDNLLLKDGHLHLTDLGLCCQLEDGARSATTTAEPSASGEHPSPAPASKHKLAFSLVGTPDYLAPEVLAKRGYDQAVDWWSVGVILYECLLGYAPFQGADASATCKNILSWRSKLSYPAERTAHLSPECLGFLRALLCEAGTRLGRAGMAEVQEHPWLAGINWEELHTQPPPHPPPAAVTAALDAARRAPIGEPLDPALIADMCMLFDDLDHLPADDPRRIDPGADAAAMHAQAAGPPGRGRARFVGYTFRRPAAPPASSLPAVGTASDGHGA